MMNNFETSGTAQLSTTQKKFGTTSMYFDGSGFLTATTTTPSQNFQFGSGDFTVEFWMYTSASVNLQGICALPHNASNYASVLVYGGGSNIIYFYSSSAGTSWDVANGIIIGTLNLNDWNHVAISKQGSSIRLFLNGTLNNTVTYSGAFSGTYTTAQIGDTASNNNYVGYIDEFRVTNGIARYTANFTPPTAAFFDQ